MVVIDADILVTRPFAPLFEDAANGRIVAFQDDYQRDRYFPEWSSLGLGIPRQTPYLNCGLLLFSATTAADFLPLFVDHQKRLDPADTHFGEGAMSNPFYYADQDVLNAMLCTRFHDRAVRLEQRLAPVPPFAGLNVEAGSGPVCRYADGAVPYALHHINRKPWLSPTRPNPYSKLFTRLVTGSEARVKLGKRDLPLRLSDSRLAPFDWWRVSIQLAARQRLRGKLGLRPAIERRVHQIRMRSGEVTDRPA
jgi:hypothetical protein